MTEIQATDHYTQVNKLYTEHFGSREQVCGIEIGTKCGDLTRTILWALPKCQLYTIDPWEHRDGAHFEAGESQEYHNTNKEWAERRLMTPEFQGRIVVLAMTSEAAHKWITENNPGKKYSFVWIDGDHSEDAIKKDLELYDPLVDDGGLIGGHDYGLCPTVTDAVNKKYGQVNTGADFTWWVFK
jgi:hypothetical protein